uniref:Uncharacterized protein n=1 Tax=Anguilla anguilla TaxID=7936 RepID=A0A0E9SXL6_ANGAN
MIEFMFGINPKVLTTIKETVSLLCERALSVSRLGKQAGS